jgi:hypothetical protein
MSKVRMSAFALALLVAASGQNTGPAQAANYHPYRTVGHVKAHLPPALNRFHRWPRPDVDGEASTSLMHAWRQRTLNQTSAITQDRNLEGYPQPRD